MSNSSPPRVVRKHKPKKIYLKSSYRKALPLLLEDFENRCAYSLVHKDEIHKKEMEVDHFDPSKKRKCGYENLFPAYSPCNNKKSVMPTAAQKAQGFRFLNPCEEMDYGAQIFEDPDTHLLVGNTKAARFHIEMLDLNSEVLVSFRRERSELRRTCNRAFLLKDSSKTGEVLKIVQSLTAMLKTKIPEIAPPP